jgi:hypothetical protein
MRGGRVIIVFGAWAIKAAATIINLLRRDRTMTVGARVFRVDRRQAPELDDWGLEERLSAGSDYATP